MNATGDFISIILGSLVSEDLTAISAGIFISRGALQWEVAFWALFIGICIGDLLLYCAGRVPSLRKLVKKKVTDDDLSLAKTHLLARFWRAMFFSRMVPGSRVALYMSAGLLRVSIASFIAASIAASFFWVTLLMLAAHHIGERVADYFNAAQTIGLFVAAFIIIAALFQVRSKRKDESFKKNRTAINLHQQFRQKHERHRVVGSLVFQIPPPLISGPKNASQKRSELNT